MGETCGRHVGEKQFIQVFGGEAGRKKTTLKT